MSELVRFGVSLEKDLLRGFDKHIKDKEYQNRSEAIRDLIREGFIKKEWLKNQEVIGAIILVYDHHKRELVNKLTDIQHDFHKLVISNQHIHLDHNNCLETVIVKGNAKEIEKLADKMKSTKGVKYGTLTAATLAKRL
ncbi:MAG: nickel-responsive transcriptional regulator NikR [Candidatus Omnitrophota bacterium]